MSSEEEQVATIDQNESQKRFKGEEDPLEGVTTLENPFAQDADFDEFEGASEFWIKSRKLSAAVNIGQENGAAIKDQSDDSYGDEDGSSDEDDAEQLMREYEKLKREREEEKRLKELVKVEEIKQRQQQEVLHGNPLLNTQLSDATSNAVGGGAYQMKRKWYEETVFRHYARNEPQEKKTFVNDTVRRDFHRRFLARTIQ